MDVHSESRLIQEAVATAEAWQERANQLLTAEEKGIQEQLKRLLIHPMDKVVLTKLIDRSFRSRDNDRVADAVNSLLREYGVPDFFSRVERLLIQMFLGLGRHFPALSVPKMIERMRQSSSRAIIPGEPEHLRAHLQKRNRQGVRMNINYLGEAVLGETECRRRLAIYLDALKDPDIECISVKISTIYSQINPLALDHTLAILKQRLSMLYREAMTNRFARMDRTRIPKFVNLDMEEYRDMEITCRAFVETLSLDEFKNYSAGIALQAYLPDAHLVQKDLTEWARCRVAKGGAPVKLRIVKGANMEMEQLEAALHDWPLATYDTKLEVDANYKRMVTYGMQPENIQAVNLGVASHNLFELAYAYRLAKHLGVGQYFYFEMLEGMADHVRRTLHESAGEVLLYAPVAGKTDFINAIGYLIRRLDENTAPENFLRYAPGLVVGSPEWRFLKKEFIASCENRDLVRLGSNRIQDRTTETFPPGKGSCFENEFHNEPNTDWSLAANRRWAEEIRKRWKKGAGHEPISIPLVVAGSDIFENHEIRDILDPGRYPNAVAAARYAIATPEDVHRAVAAAKADPDGWRNRSWHDRQLSLSNAARELRLARGDLIGAAAADTGKVFSETDVEVSEAIDFTEYYPFSVRAFTERKHLLCRGRGVGVVISPWNFPVAIPCGGIVAALASGNTVILKPSSDSVLATWEMCRCFWKAGISKNILQFLPCDGGTLGACLVGHPDVDFIILTGGTETSLKIIGSRPGVYLSAETGGKNATIVTAMADRDQAIKNVVYSAFGNGGQKCSATSLLILEGEIYDDPLFREQLIDATASLPVGSAWDFENKIGPLIRPPAGNLKRAMTSLEPEESWALKPENLNGNPLLWTPGIKWNVQPASFTHMTELFGPLLGVMRAENLDHAVDLANQTGYGLTSGLESLDKREQLRWKQRIKAGNLYINRGTTGAVTLRQPFGGMGKSALGPGLKAGGPDYVVQFMSFKETAPPPAGGIEKESELLHLVQRWRLKVDWGQMVEFRYDVRRTIRAVKSYLFHMEQRFSKETDYFHLRGQDNVLRYIPVETVVIRVHNDDSLFDILARIAASRICGCTSIVSIPAGLRNRKTAFLFGPECRSIRRGIEILFQQDHELIAMLSMIDRIRYADPERVPEKVLAAAASAGFFIARSPVVSEGRVELLHYFRQQSVCDNYHRYGNLGERSLILQSDYL